MPTHPAASVLLGVPEELDGLASRLSEASQLLQASGDSRSAASATEAEHLVLTARERVFAIRPQAEPGATSRGYLHVIGVVRSQVDVCVELAVGFEQERTWEVRLQPADHEALARAHGPLGEGVLVEVEVDGAGAPIRILGWKR